MYCLLIVIQDAICLKYSYKFVSSLSVDSCEDIAFLGRLRLRLIGTVHDFE